MLASGKLSWYSELRPLARQMGDVEGVSERKKMTLDDAADRSLYCNRKKSPFVGREVQKRAHRAAPSRRVSGEPWKKPIAIIAPGPK